MLRNNLKNCVQQVKMCLKGTLCLYCETNWNVPHPMSCLGLWIMNRQTASMIRARPTVTWPPEGYRALHRSRLSSAFLPKTRHQPRRPSSGPPSSDLWLLWCAGLLVSKPPGAATAINCIPNAQTICKGKKCQPEKKFNK